MALGRQLSICGVAGLIILLGEGVVGFYNAHLLNTRQTPLFSNARGLQVCAAANLAAAVCAVIAMRRGASGWWSAIVVVGTLAALSCFFGEV